MSIERLTVFETDKGHFAVRHIEWAGIWGDNGKIQECGLRHTAIFATKEDAEWYANTKNSEEQGLMLMLPCKVGDIVYRINNGARKPIIPLYVVELRFKQVGSYIREKICCSDDSMTKTASSIYYKEDIGNRIFLSKSEAEQKLKEMDAK